MRRTIVLVLLLATVPRPLLAQTKPADFSLLRIDVEDGFALHPWIYHEFRLSPHWGILGDVTFQTPGLNGRFPPFAELDIGPLLHVGDLQINPEIGFDLVWNDDPDGGHTRAGEFILQLYLIYAWQRLNIESWNLYFIPFDGSANFFQMRQLLTVRVAWELSLGPHIEATFVEDVGTDRFAIGGDLAYRFPWGQLVLFLASERMRKVAEFRLTYLREL